MSETDFLKLKKHDNVETNTEKFDIENYLNGNWDKINENAKKVNTDILNINLKNKEQDTNIGQLQENTETSSNKITELEKELKEAQEDFYQNSIRGQASGEYIHVEDSSNCRSIIGISGNHEQETRSGKNKIEIKKTTTTVNGCTHTIKDGTDTLSGTSSTNWANLIIYSFVGDGKTYTLSGSPSTSKNIFISAHDNVQKKDLATSKNGSTGTFVATSGNSIDIIICVAPNLTLANELFKPQLEEGLKATVWEQGGASPSPDYPSKIEVVGSNVNLFAGGDTVTNNGVTFTKNKDDSYDIVGMATEQANSINFVDIQNSGIINGNIYNIHVSENLPDGVKILIEAYNDTAWIRHVLGSSLIPNVSKANIENANKIRFTLRVEKGISVNIHNLRIKLEKDTIETAYSKYGQGCVKVTKCNKNILNIEDIDETEKNGIKYSVKNGILKLNGTATASFDIQLSKNIKIKKGKYTHSSSYIQPGLYISFNNLGYTIISAQVGKKRTFEITEDTTYKSYFIWIDKGTVLNNVEIKLQLEAGTTVTDFIEHQSQSVIMPVQKEMLEGDYVADVEHHEWKKLTLTGNENIKLNTAFANVFNIEIPKINIMNQQVCLCNIAKGVVYNTALLTIQNNIIMTASLNKIVYKSTKFSSLSEFKTYLQNQYEEGTPVIVYYKLAEPINLELTDEQKAVAKELNNARTYKNVTNITTDSKAILSLDYAKDHETQNQKMQNEIDEIKQLLSTTQTSAMLLDNLQKEVEEVEQTETAKEEE